MVLSVIREFCQESGQTVSHDKSIGFFGPKIPSRVRHYLLETAGIQTASTHSGQGK